jgi:TRAP-type mannitol/chloroaromatic compound transport system substrate-binding protein
MTLTKWATALAVAGSLAFGAADASAQEKRVRIQMGGAFSSTTGLLGPTQLALVESIRALSQGTIDIRFFEPGALVPSSQYFDAVGNGSLDAAWTVSGFFTGKDIAFAMYAAVPFGPEAGEYLGWMRFGGGQKMYEELHDKYGIVAIPCGLIAPEASGWFRKEIKSLDDLKGLKMRFFGLGANVMQKMGVATQLLQAGEIFQALQLGTIDATEFSMPVMDLTLGFHQVAKHYYFPGWHQMSTINSLYISKPKWAEMSDWQKLVVRTACNQTMLAQFVEGESVQGKALKEIQSKGVTLHYWPPEVLAAFRKAWDEVAAEQAAKSPEFKKAWDSYQAFRAEYAVWKNLGYLKN